MASIKLTISNLFESFPNAVKNLTLTSICNVQQFLSPTAIDEIVSQEFDTKTGSGHRVLRSNLADNKHYGDLSLFHKISTSAGTGFKRQLAVTPVLLLISTIVSFTPQIRERFVTSYSGQVPIFFSWIMSSVRTGQLGSSNDQVSGLALSDNYLQWLDQNKLTNSIVDPRFIMQDDNIDLVFSFLSAVSADYLPAVDWKNLTTRTGSTVTLTGLHYDVDVLEVSSHPGTSFPKEDGKPSIPVETCLLAIVLRINLLMPDGSPYRFSSSDSGRRNTLGTRAEASVFVKTCLTVSYHEPKKTEASERVQRNVDTSQSVLHGNLGNDFSNSKLKPTSTSNQSAGSNGKKARPPQKRGESLKAKAYRNYPGDYLDERNSSRQMYYLLDDIFNYLREKLTP